MSVRMDLPTPVKRVRTISFVVLCARRSASLAITSTATQAKMKSDTRIKAVVERIVWLAVSNP